RVAERTRELNVANQQLRELSGRLLQMRDEEGRRLARALHDSVGQMVAALSMNLSRVQREAANLSPEAAKALEENGGLIKEINREIRTISHLHHPPLLEEAGLASALSWYVDGFSQRSKIDVKLQLPPHLERMSKDAEISIFRTVQEGLTNIHRHSGSPTAGIRIEQKDGIVRLEIRDAGKGIPPEKRPLLGSWAPAGVGLRGMRERMRQLGGSLEVHSNADGTVLTATLPVIHEPNAGQEPDSTTI
ncbi:MAG: sensor histidine kinase, partial [Acidobacteriales bacterium]|nr:sensor histidine kinase [Terriglobales bacterium]